MTKYSTFLFAPPSFLEGAARAIDFGDFLTEYNAAPNDEMADSIALTADWLAIGNDMRAAMAQFARELEARRIAHASAECDRITAK